MIYQHYETGMNEKGFTLIELLIAIMISVVIGGILVMVYEHSRKLSRQHDIISSLQQNLRAGMYILEEEIRQCGADPLGKTDPKDKIIAADSQNFCFQMDADRDGDITGVGEKIRYGFGSTANAFNLFPLARESGNGGMRMIIENIEILDFRYLDENGQLLNPDADNNITTADPLTNGSNDYPLIRAVEITLISRSGNQDRGHKDNTTYRNLQDMVLLNANNDNYYRKTLSKRIMLRNM